MKPKLIHVEVVPVPDKPGRYRITVDFEGGTLPEILAEIVRRTEDIRRFGKLSPVIVHPPAIR